MDTNQEQLNIVSEYALLACRQELSELEAKRMSNILEIAQEDDVLCLLINEVDYFVCSELNLLDEVNLEYYENQKARIKEFIGTKLESDWQLNSVPSLVTNNQHDSVDDEFINELDDFLGEFLKIEEPICIASLALVLTNLELKETSKSLFNLVISSQKELIKGEVLSSLNSFLDKLFKSKELICLGSLGLILVETALILSNNKKNTGNSQNVVLDTLETPIQDNLIKGKEERLALTDPSSLLLPSTEMGVKPIKEKLNYSSLTDILKDSTIEDRVANIDTFNSFSKFDSNTNQEQNYFPNFVAIGDIFEQHDEMLSVLDFNIGCAENAFNESSSNITSLSGKEAHNLITLCPRPLHGEFAMAQISSQFSSVPEPTSGLSFLAFAAVVIISTFKSKNNNKKFLMR